MVHFLLVESLLYNMSLTFRYVSVLVDLARVEGGTEHSGIIAQQLLDVAIRVEAIRPFVTQQMVGIFEISLHMLKFLFSHQAILLENSQIFANGSHVCEVLYAAAWICGEFAEYVYVF